MAMIFDTRVGGARSQFATQLQHVPAHIVADIEAAFVNDETPDFYEGLLAGFVAAYQISAHYPPDVYVEYLGAVVAHISARK